MSSEVLVKVDDLSKKFCRDLKKSLWYGFKDIGTELFNLKGETETQTLRKGEFWVNKDINFEVKRGECLGLIGKNGAGKSTLLKILTGLIKPDVGSITLKGRVGALIELGAGFNPILTGRENVFNNGAILGFSKQEMLAKYDEIVAFAELEEFMDSPVQYYSSGMKVRLGFAVATSLEPDILILDEVLAVGDAAFRAKCYNRIGKMKQNAAMIFVSHSMQQVSQVCTDVLVLSKGEVSWLGEVGKGINIYNTQNTYEKEDKEEDILIIEEPIKSADLNIFPKEIKFNKSFILIFQAVLIEDMPDSMIRIAFYNPEGLVVAEWTSKRNNKIIDFKKGDNKIELKIGPLNLRGGNYKIGFVVNDSSGVYLPYWSLKKYSIKIIEDFSGVCEYQIITA